MDGIKHPVMPTNGPTIDDATNQLYIDYSVFIGIYVVVLLFFIPSILGGCALPPASPVGVIQTIVAL